VIGKVKLALMGDAQTTDTAITAFVDKALAHQQKSIDDATASTTATTEKDLATINKRIASLVAMPRVRTPAPRECNRPIGEHSPNYWTIRHSGFVVFSPHAVGRH